jgi:hypothetical protein
MVDPLIARTTKSEVDSPGACRAPGWHGVRSSNAAKLKRSSRIGQPPGVQMTIAVPLPGGR